MGYTILSVSANVIYLSIRIFEAVRVPEVDIIDEFASKYCQSTADLSHPLKRQRTDVSSHCQHPASIGEQVMVNHPNLSQVTIVAQVAARISRSDEWILANVVSCDTSSQQYEVHDEDDAKKIVKLPFTFVRRLEDNASDIRRGDVVHCVFPDTTSFYRAVVVKSPKVPGQGQPWEVVVRFDDDEDETGKAPPRRVPARFVMRESAFKK